jgi:hypothetical protein
MLRCAYFCCEPLPILRCADALAPVSLRRDAGGSRAYVADAGSFGNDCRVCGNSGIMGTPGSVADVVSRRPLNQRVAATLQTHNCYEP